jgi:SAM-dependent methyltransferase
METMMKILNLGCGTKTSSNPNVVNIDWSIYLRIKNNRLLRAVAPFFLKDIRLERFNSLPDNVIVHNLAKGIPFDSNSIDVVYHSHLLEHLDKGVAKRFLLEVKRVLKPGGIQRIVVPDFEKACSAYVSHIAACEKNAEESEMHDSYIASIIEQSVRREAFGASQETPFRRLIENKLLGDARKRGETHQWMYDRINLSVILTDLGYNSPQLQNYNRSLIPGWGQYGLDTDEYGNEYKPGSLYMEAQN